MSNPSYFDAYKNLAMSRDDSGVLTVRFHAGGDPVVFTGRTHEPLRSGEILLRAWTPSA
jgi:hypothetical protein